MGCKFITLREFKGTQHGGERSGGIYLSLLRLRVKYSLPGLKDYLHVNFRLTYVSRMSRTPTNNIRRRHLHYLPVYRPCVSVARKIERGVQCFCIGALQ